MIAHPPPQLWQRAALLLALTFLCYGVGLGNGFTFDDHPYLEQNPHLRSWSGIQYLAFHPLQEGETLRGLLYRPLAAAVQGLLGSLFGFGPTTFHAANLVIYSLLGLVLFAFLSRLFPPTLAWMATLLFVVHPVHSEAVASAVGLTELLAAGLMVLAWYLAALPGTTSLRAGRLTAIFALTLGALLCKETVILLPAMTIFSAWLVGRRGRELWRLGGASLFAIGCYFGLRYQVIGSWLSAAQVSLSPLDNPLALLPAGERFAQGLLLLGRSVGLLLWPSRLSADYSLASLPPSSNIGWVGLAVLLHVLWVAAAFWLRRRVPALTVGVVIFYLGLLPTANLFFASGTIFAERFLLLPVLGLALPLAFLLDQVPKPRQFWAHIALAILLLAGAARTFVRVGDWRDDATLFAATLAAYPNNAKANYNLAVLKKRAGDGTAARPLAERAVAIYPDYGDARVVAAQLAAEVGDSPRALELLREGVRRTPGHEQLWVQLSQWHLARGELVAGSQALAAGAAVLPASVVLPFNQALVELELGRPLIAEPLLRQVLAKVDLPDGHYALGQILLGRGDWTRAEVAFGKAAASKTWAKEARFFRALVWVEMGQPAQALQLLGPPDSVEAALVAAAAERALGNATNVAQILDQLQVRQAADCPPPEAPLGRTCRSFF